MKTKRIPFDIEKAKNGAKVITRDGRPVRICAYDVKCVNKNYPILALVQEGENEITYSFMTNGKFFQKENKDSPNDLFIEEEEKEKPRREYSGADSIYVSQDDEGIREELIDAINGLWDNDALPMPLSMKRKDAWLAWLEKQGVEKPADSLEISPDKWYVCIEMCHSIDVIDFAEGHYYLGSDILKYGLLEKSKDYIDYFQPWNIKDAKDGDVLYSGEVIFIFNRIKGEWIHCCCTLHRDGSFISENYDLMHIKYCKEVQPATKEQRDILFQKIKEEGYEWNPDKKELKKIKPKFKVGDVMRTLEEVKAGITEGLPVVVSIDDDKCHCNNETIYIKDQDEYEYPPMNYFEIIPDKWYVCTHHILSDDVTEVWFKKDSKYLGHDILRCDLHEDDSYQNYFRPWTIQDAKSGDILVSKDGFDIVIFKQIETLTCFSSYYNIRGTVDDGWANDIFTPATLEQCAHLFKKMKEEGYEWDSDKKELHEIGESKTRRMTNQELADWLCQCPEECREFKYKTCSTVLKVHVYYEEKANEPAEYILIRKNHGEWQEPLIEE